MIKIVSASVRSEGVYVNVLMHDDAKAPEPGDRYLIIRSNNTISLPSFTYERQFSTTFPAAVRKKIICVL